MYVKIFLYILILRQEFYQIDTECMNFLQNILQIFSSKYNAELIVIAINSSSYLTVFTEKGETFETDFDQGQLLNLIKNHNSNEATLFETSKKNYNLIKFPDSLSLHASFLLVEEMNGLTLDPVDLNLLSNFVANYLYNVHQQQKFEEKIKVIYEANEDLIFELDSEGKIININMTGALLLEYIPQELIGVHFLDLISISDKSLIAKSFQDILKFPKIISFEASLISKYGKTLNFKINAKACFELGSIDRVIGVCRNITSRKGYQDKVKELNNKLIEANRLISIERERARQKISVLEELNRLKNDFVSNISHELRTPLASIIGFSETIDSDSAMPDEMRKEFNQIILDEAKRLSKIINNLLDISRIEGGKLVLSKTEFDLVDALNPIINFAEKKAKEKTISFSKNIDEKEIKIFADKERIEQLFENLISNSFKFTNSGGRITLMVQSQYKEVEIIISDTGIGIPKKDIPFIYQKFYKVSREGADYPGTGLGLSLVKQIIDLHKGMILIQSDENKGTTFIIKLPRN